jgi:hypothetical protein
MGIDLLQSGRSTNPRTLSIEHALKFSLLPFVKHGKCVKLCTSLPEWILRLYTKALHLSICDGNKITKTNLGAAPRTN